ncbi:MAG: amidase [Rhodospirillales bacterium]|jgi:amidase|nr:amidase [Rhodospirillales bacterium]MBT4039359.1 amidase [Rhodospirillales bacterium]MBT4626239.1 amidase [Rhodospirillales bacterium]MBT5353092.1 amidase [Rhodospirillales bacterium]MBT5520779.1 amidase [Rhodospirillales bacterium]
MENIAFLDATAQAELVRSKDVTPLEMVNAAIDRIEKLNPDLNAVIMPFFDMARDAATRALDHSDAPFCGVPFLLKDLVSECEGMPRTDGSAYLAGQYVSKEDCELVRRYKQAGLIIMGKTNSSEYGLLPTTEPGHYGPTCNPWDLSRGTGGSSGGSSAAVASGMVAAAHANDGGGSIRIPASACGLVGLKPTRGRNSLAPNYGDILGGIICEHVVTRSVRDSAAILDATNGSVPGEPYAPTPPAYPYLEQIKQTPKRLRIALGTEPLTGAETHADCIAAAHATAKLCEDLGHDVEIASPQVDSRAMLKSFGIAFTNYLVWAIQGWQQITGREPAEEHFEPVTWKMYQHGLGMSGGKYLLAMQQLQKINRDFGLFFEDYDVWLTPTLAQPPVPLGYFEYTPETRDEHFKRLGDFTGFTLIANATGQPGISLPLHWNDANLPIGTHFTGRYGDEATLLSLAAQLEQAKPWADRRPPVSA